MMKDQFCFLAWARSARRLVVPLGLLAGVILGARGSTLSVTNTNDGGPGSLRQAILDHNAQSGEDRIAFRIPGTDLKTIAPVTDLPDLAGSVTLDGFTQPGSAPNTSATGSNAVLLIELRGPGGGGDGLRLTGSGTVRGLVVDGWNGTADSAGIHFTSVAGAGRVRGCHIGTNAPGTAARANGIGVLVEAADVNVGADIFQQSSVNADRNLISGNESDGVRISGAARNVVSGNLIGLDASGLAGLGNGGDGIAVFNAASVSIGCGGVSPFEPGIACSNVVGKNGGAGIRFTGPLAAFGEVYPASIGTDTTGTMPLGNTGPGVLIESGAHHITVGSFGDVFIAFNEGPGVALTGDGTGNAVVASTVFGNTGRNIDLGNDGATANDTCDADSGPNNFQNAPVLAQVTSVSGTLYVQGSLEAEPGGTYVLEYFVSPSCAAENPAAGRLSDQALVSSQGDCTLAFEHALDNLSLSRAPGEDFLVVIARSYSPGFNGTSEISNCLALPPPVDTGVDLGLDLSAGAGAFTCAPNPRKKVCSLGTKIAFLNNANPWLTGDLALTSMCKKTGTPLVACKIIAAFSVASLDAEGIPAHAITAYLSADTSVDSTDPVIGTFSTQALSALARGRKPAKIKYKHPRGQEASGLHILLKIDSQDAVAESDESNNVLVVGTLP